MPTAEFLKLAQKRLHRVPKMPVYIPRSEVQTWKMRRMADIFVPGIEEFQGLEHLPEIRERAANGEETGVGQHITDLDPAARRKALESVGAKDVADKFAFFVGWKMYERLQTRIWMGAEESINGPTPADLDLAEKEGAAFKDTPNDDLSPEGKIVMAYKELVEVRARKAVTQINAMKKDGYIPYFFPESTRSRTGLTGEAPERVGAQLIRDVNGYIFSMVVTGQERAMRPEQKWNPLERGPIKVVLSQPYPVRLIQEWREEGRKIGEKRYPGDFVMAEITSHLTPAQIEPRVRSKYREINEWRKAHQAA